MQLIAKIKHCPNHCEDCMGISEIFDENGKIFTCTLREAMYEYRELINRIKARCKRGLITERS